MFGSMELLFNESNTGNELVRIFGLAEAQFDRSGLRGITPCLYRHFSYERGADQSDGEEKRKETTSEKDAGFVDDACATDPEEAESLVIRDGREFGHRDIKGKTRCCQWR